MFMRATATAILVVAVATFAGCSTRQSSTELPVPASRQDSPESYEEASNAFAFDLARQTMDGQTVVLGPSSVFSALAMTLNGADGTTHDAMRAALHVEAFTDSALNAGAAELADMLADSVEGARARSVNSLWAEQRATFIPEFVTTCRNLFGAHVEALDLQSPEAPGRINAWVSDATEQRIDRIVETIDPQTVLFLINATTFTGTWTVPFRANDTRDTPFHLDDGTSANVPMMRRTSTIDHANIDGMQIARLPYGDGSFDMVLVLPAEDAGIASIETLLAPAAWDSALSQLEPAYGMLGLPRMEISYKTSLNTILSDLGMGVAFDSQRADFSRMLQPASGNAWISEVLHKTYLRVDELGTEAAAVTSVAIGVRAVVRTQEPTFRMILDRPFFLAIRDARTGALLFTGTILDPR